MIDKLIENIKKKQAPVMVGLDPTMKLVPEHIKQKAFAEYGETLKGAAEAVWMYNKGIVDAVHDLIPAVKPQIAMYEQFGVEGVIAYQKTVEYCKQKGLVVVGDIKRGDIGSTSEHMRWGIWDKYRSVLPGAAVLMKTSPQSIPIWDPMG